MTLLVSIFCWGWLWCLGFHISESVTYTFLTESLLSLFFHVKNCRSKVWEQKKSSLKKKKHILTHLRTFLYIYIWHCLESLSQHYWRSSHKGATLWSCFAFTFCPVHQTSSVWCPSLETLRCSSIMWCLHTHTLFSSDVFFGSLSCSRMNPNLTNQPVFLCTCLSLSPFWQQCAGPLPVGQGCPNNASEGAVTQFVPTLPLYRQMACKPSICRNCFHWLSLISSIFSFSSIQNLSKVNIVKQLFIVEVIRYGCDYKSLIFHLIKKHFTF